MFFPIFSFIQIYCKETFNNSFDEEFHALQACVIGLERIDFETGENLQIKRSSVSIWIPTADIFLVFSLIQIHYKETFNDSFDAEFHALQACVIALERINFKNVRNSKIKRSRVSIWVPTPDIFPILSLIQFHCKEAFNISFDAEFHALQASVI